MHRSRALSIAPGTFFVAQSWADSITDMPGFNLRQAQADATVLQASLDGLWRVPRASLLAGLQRALADTSPLVRRAAAKAAPFYANEAMVALLRDLDGKDTDAEVRVAALNALRLIRERDARLTAL